MAYARSCGALKRATKEQWLDLFGILPVLLDLERPLEL